MCRSGGLGRLISSRPSVLFVQSTVLRSIAVARFDRGNFQLDHFGSANDGDRRCLADAVIGELAMEHVDAVSRFVVESDDQIAFLNAGAGCGAIGLDVRYEDGGFGL